MSRSDEDNDADGDGDAEDDDADEEGNGVRYRNVRYIFQSRWRGAGRLAVGMSPPRTVFVEIDGAQRSSFNSNPNVGRLNTTDSSKAWSNSRRLGRGRCHLSPCFLPCFSLLFSCLPLVCVELLCHAVLV